jgi:hypothetical protein
MIRAAMMIVAGLAGGATGAQAPEFAQQYAQRLGGALDEVRAFIARFDADAAREGLTRAVALARMDASSDPFVRRRAATMRETIARQAGLERQRMAIEGTGAFGRVGAVIRDFDAGVAARAWADYRPAVPLTGEGQLFALGGLGAGALIGGILGLPMGRRQPKPSLNRLGARYRRGEPAPSDSERR